MEPNNDQYDVFNKKSSDHIWVIKFDQKTLKVIS